MGSHLTWFLILGRSNVMWGSCYSEYQNLAYNKCPVYSKYQVLHFKIDEFLLQEYHVTWDIPLEIMLALSSDEAGTTCSI